MTDEPIAWLRDLDGTDSYHSCARGDPGAFPVYGDPDASPLRTRIAELEVALRTADEALCAYACHAGPDAPCIRSKDQCASECGKAAGDALLALRATLNGEKKHG